VRRPVIAVTPRDWKLPANEMAYREWLEESGWARQLAIADLTPDSADAALAQIAPLDENPLDALAGVLESRLPKLFAGA
jgi:hypothetical protein